VSTPEWAEPAAQSIEEAVRYSAVGIVCGSADDLRRGLGKKDRPQAGMLFYTSARSSLTRSPTSSDTPTAVASGQTHFRSVRRLRRYPRLVPVTRSRTLDNLRRSATLESARGNPEAQSVHVGTNSCRIGTTQTRVPLRFDQPSTGNRVSDESIGQL
jgi:hypothetical protein